MTTSLSYKIRARTQSVTLHNTNVVSAQMSLVRSLESTKLPVMITLSQPSEWDVFKIAGPSFNGIDVGLRLCSGYTKDSTRNLYKFVCLVRFDFYFWITNYYILVNSENLFFQFILLSLLPWCMSSSKIQFIGKFGSILVLVFKLKKNAIID